MKIHAGCEISYDCLQPTPMILQLSVHPSRVPDLLNPDRIRFDPPLPANTYHDGFGNFCHVIRAPKGRMTMSTDFMVQDSGEPDVVAPQAEQHALEETALSLAAVGCLDYYFTPPLFSLRVTHSSDWTALLAF